MHWDLAISDQTNAALHEGTDVEVIGLKIVSGK
jgi:hypothetical protein